jgi:hypothetical protein
MTAPAQAKERVRIGKGHGVAGADCLGQAEILEHTLEDEA